MSPRVFGLQIHAIFVGTSRWSSTNTRNVDDTPYYHFFISHISRRIIWVSNKSATEVNTSMSLCGPTFSLASEEIQGQCAARVSQSGDEWSCVVDIAPGTLGLTAPRLCPGTMLRGTVSFTAYGNADVAGQTHTLRTLAGDVPSSETILAVVNALGPHVCALRPANRPRRVSHQRSLAPVISLSGRT